MIIKSPRTYAGVVPKNEQLPKVLKATPDGHTLVVAAGREDIDMFRLLTVD